AQFRFDGCPHFRLMGVLISVTKSSPTRHLTLRELIRYLDYCSELLSLTSKIAALYVQRFSDEVVMNSVSDVEQLCAGLA
ncbi:MAG: hypothetical protein O7B81_12515, partial [Gammaproteobacteria bacterium]|nr:hypothetical protein [Gammaproteobacteria bacterium]